MALAGLRHLPLLQSLSDEQLNTLGAQLAWARFQPGETVVQQGQADCDFFIVMEGQVELLLESDLPTRLQLLIPGDFFGEGPALTGGLSPYRASALTAAAVLRIAPEGFQQLLEASPGVHRHLIVVLTERLQQAGAKLHRARLRERSLADHITRQGARAHPEWVGTGAWSQRVRAAIVRGSRTMEPVIFVGEEGTGKELAAARMHYNGLRRDGPFVVLDAEGWTEQAWTDHLRMAAHGTLLLKRVHLLPPEGVSAVARVLPRAAGAASGPGGPSSRGAASAGQASPLPGNVPRLMATAPSPDGREPSPVEAAILTEGFAVFIAPLRERREDIPLLVRHFLRRLALLPSGDLALQPVSREALQKLETYPFFGGNVRELERVVREAALLAGGGTIQAEHLRLGRRPARAGRLRVGLALGGGVIRGAAHIGVLRALAEEGIPVDLIAGTSSGSLIGALYAGGRSWKEMQTLVAGTGWLDLVELNWPRAGFLTSRKMRQFIERQIGDRSCEDLAIPFAAVAADANAGTEVILREGSVGDLVRASTAIPGIFQPVSLDGRLLVDGVVVNNVPANVARAMGADLVIAVDVTQYGFTSGPPRSVGEAVMRAFDIMARQNVTASLEWADIVIRPQLHGLNGFSPKSAPEFVRRGYAAAREAMPEIRTRLSALRSEAI